jgi:hypothetical protein
MPQTRHSNPKCYAQLLHDCSAKAKISREHYVSKSLLKVLDDNGGLHVSGFRWQPDDNKKPISPKALASRMLCERHNSSLSRVDDIAVRLFQAMDEKDAAHGGRFLYLFSGHDIERWLLKILCGLMRSKSLSFAKEIDASIPPEWLRVLFGQRDFLDGCGLYVRAAAGHYFEGPYGLKFQPITNRYRITGLGIWICSLIAHPPSTFLRKWRHRPCRH